MTLVILIRHGQTDVAGRTFTGRAAGISLNDYGRSQAEALPGRLREVPVTAIWSSPMGRAQETARPLAAARSLDIQTHDALTEVDYGHWQGLTIEDLADDPGWVHYNHHRSLTRIPGGESLLEIQLRMVGVLEQAIAEHPAGCVVMVSHGDPLRALVMHLLGMGLDDVLRFEISPGSVTPIRIDGGVPIVLAINDTGALPRLLA